MPPGKLSASGTDLPKDGKRSGIDNLGNAAAGNEISYETLIKGIPLTAETLAACNEMVAQNLFELAKLYQNELEDYQEAVTTYEESLQRYPDKLYDGELYYGLFYCYSKLGNQMAANNYKGLLLSRFPNTKAGKTISNPQASNPKNANPAATQKIQRHIQSFY